MSDPIKKFLGKIEKVSYGEGGYQDMMFGISFELKSELGTMHEFWGSQGSLIEHNHRCGWTEQERIEEHGNTAMRVSKLLNEVKVRKVSQLKGVPIEITTNEGGTFMRSWRVLTEVL